MYSVIKSIMTLYKLSSYISHHTNSLIVMNIYNLQCFFFVLLLVLLQIDGIETDPGPENAHELSILHLNIRSIRNKLKLYTILDKKKKRPYRNAFSFELAKCTIQKKTHTKKKKKKKKKKNNGGGVLEYLNSSLLHVGRPDLEICL